MKKQLLILATALLSISTFAQIPTYVPANGLVGWWPFNGNANDESGNGNHGTVNGTTLTADRYGVVNKAYSFDGASSYISINDHPSLDVPNVSISAWYWAIDYGTIAQQTQGNIVSKREQSGWGNSFQVALEQSSPINGVWAQYTINGSNGWVYYNSNEILTTQNWIHVVYTHDNSEAKLYINGNLVNSTLVNGGLNSNDLPMWFGARPFAGPLSHFLHGSLDDIGIWNRALTACEIQDLYHAQLGSQAISAGADQSICSGDPVTLNGSGGSTYQWNNNVVDGQAFTPNQSANYVLNGTDSLGCQGTDTVVVTVLENAVSTLTQTALDSYTLNGQTYTQSGTYTQTLPAANGCDSTITLNLTLNFTGLDELGTVAKKLVKITDLNGKIIPRRKNTLMLFIYEDGTVERVVEIEE
jgi:Concanavalin A-like lectin/glucanases superfamily